MATYNNLYYGTTVLSSCLRTLRKCMVEVMDPDLIREECQMIPGGDIRQRGNGWIRDAWGKAGIQRIPREHEFAKIIANLVHHYKLCAQAVFVWFVPLGFHQHNISFFAGVTLNSGKKTHRMFWDPQLNY